MKKRTPVGDSLELLYAIREEVGSGVENGVLERLDEAIELLQKAEGKGEELSSQDVLDTVGDVLKALPAIAAIIEMLSKLLR